MNLSTMCWLQPAHSGISAGREPLSAPLAPPPPRPARPSRCPGAATDRRRTLGWPEEQQERNHYSFKFVIAAPWRAANARAEHTPGEVPGRTGINKKGSDGNRINPPSERRQSCNYPRLFFPFLNFQNSPAGNGGGALMEWGKKLPKITRIALKMKTRQSCPVPL